MSLFLVIVVAGFIGIGYLLALARGLSQWNQSYRVLGKRYVGKQPKEGVMSGYFLTTPTLTFDYGRTFCKLKSRRPVFSPRSKVTEFWMSWPDHRLRVDLTAPRVDSRRWGMKPVSIRPDFDRQFSVLANQPDQVAKMIAAPAQWRLDQLRTLGASNDLLVVINRGQMVISKNGFLIDYRQLDELVRLSLELFDQWMLGYTEGIDFVQTEEATICDEVKCPICSEQIEGVMVVCPRCQTPHCQDCWEYNGQCATYACQETKYRKVNT